MAVSRRVPEVPTIRSAKEMSIPLSGPCSVTAPSNAAVAEQRALLLNIYVVVTCFSLFPRARHRARARGNNEYFLGCGRSINRSLLMELGKKFRTTWLKPTRDGRNSECSNLESVKKLLTFERTADLNKLFCCSLPRTARRSLPMSGGRGESEQISRWHR